MYKSMQMHELKHSQEFIMAAYREQFDRFIRNLGCRLQLHKAAQQYNDKATDSIWEALQEMPCQSNGKIVWDKNTKEFAFEDHTDSP